MIREQTNCVVLVLGGDDNYALPMAVAIYSALRNLCVDVSVDLYILDGGISVENKGRIEQIVEECNSKVSINWKKIQPEKLNGLSVKNPWLSTSTYLRLWIPEIVPDAYSRAIYLDSDLIVEGCLSGLWREPFDDKALLAVRDCWIPYVSSPEGVHGFAEIGIDAQRPYFNAGVLVFNLPRWREDSLSEVVLTYLRNNAENVRKEDQEALNATLFNEWKELNSRWNVPPFVFSSNWRNRIKRMSDCEFKHQVRERLPHVPEEANIIHFVAASKPWKPDSHYPSQHLWYRYFWESGWLSPQARLVSRAKFYARYFLMAAAKAVREGTRPARHWLSAYAPKTVRRLLRKE